MAIGTIADREPAEQAFQKINETITTVNSHETRLDSLETLAESVLIKRTVSTAFPETIPVDGEEWLVV